MAFCSAGLHKKRALQGYGISLRYFCRQKHTLRVPSDPCHRQGVRKSAQQRAVKIKFKKNQKFSKKEKRALDTKRAWVIYSFSRRNEAAASRKGGQKSLKKIKKINKALDKLVKSVLISFSPSVKTVDTSSLKRKSVKEKERQDSRRRRKFPSVWKSFSSIERMPAEPRKRFCKRRPEPGGSGCSYQFIGWDG